MTITYSVTDIAINRPLVECGQYYIAGNVDNADTNAPMIRDLKRPDVGIPISASDLNVAILSKANNLLDVIILATVAENIGGKYIEEIIEIVQKRP